MPYINSITYYLKLIKFYLIQKCSCATHCVIIGKPEGDVFHESGVLKCDHTRTVFEKPSVTK